MSGKILSPFNEYDTRVINFWAMTRPFHLTLRLTDRGEEYYSLEPLYHWRDVDEILADLHVVRLGSRVLAVSGDRELASGPTMADALNALARRLPDGPRLRDASPRPIGPRGGSAGRRASSSPEGPTSASNAPTQANSPSAAPMVVVGRGQPWELPIGDWRRRLQSYTVGRLKVPRDQAISAAEIQEARRVRARKSYLRQRARLARDSEGEDKS